jgi:hypothetical protein
MLVWPSYKLGHSDDCSPSYIQQCWPFEWSDHIFDSPLLPWSDHGHIWPGWSPLAKCWESSRILLQLKLSKLFFVNLWSTNITMENHNSNGQINCKWQCSIAMLVYQIVAGRSQNHCKAKWLEFSYLSDA